MKMKPVDYLMIFLVSLVMIYNGIAISSPLPSDPIQQDYKEVVDLLCSQYPHLHKESDVWKAYPELWTAQQMIKESCRLHCRINSLFGKAPTAERLQLSRDCKIAMARLRAEAGSMIAEIRNTIRQ